MDIRNSLDSLKSILGVTQPATAATEARSNAAVGGGAFNSDRATLSNAGNEVSSTAADSDVRMEKVASVQAALAAGTYDVPVSAVASKLVDAMMGGEG
jgi:negative regulator of flagellin synthesis FlgM